MSAFERNARPSTSTVRGSIASGTSRTSPIRAVSLRSPGGAMAREQPLTISRSSRHCSRSSLP